MIQLILSNKLGSFILTDLILRIRVVGHLVNMLDLDEDVQAKAILRREKDLHRCVERIKPVSDPQVIVYTLKLCIM
jgi:hypothetical protein